MKSYIIIILSLISVLNGQAQQNGQKPDKAVEKLVNKGLRAYDKADYSEAELDFRKALAKDPVNAVASYNLGLTQTELDKNLEAAHYFEKAAKQADDPLLKSKSYFNQGNVWFNKKKYEKAVEAYKNALRQNSSDEEARYNLALAQLKLKQQQKKNKKNKKNQKNKQQNKQNKQNKDQKNKDQKNKKDQNKKGQNKKDQQKNQNKQNKKDQNKKGKGDQKKDQNKQNKQGKDKKDKGKQDQQKQNQQGRQKGQKQPEKQGQGQKRKAQLTPQQVKQILVALKNKEQKTQKKIKAKILKGSGKKHKQDKDW